MFDTSGYGLEVGPSYNPLLPKSEGFNVKSLDHADQAALVAKYKVIDHPVWNIEPVDYVSDGRPMSEIIGQTAVFDFIVASHVIEHTTDMIGFIQDCERLLKPDGVLVLAIPDKRFCFDYFKPITSLGQIVQAHIEKRARHAPATFFDHHFYHSERGGKVVWMQYDNSNVGVVNNDVRHAKYVMDLHASNPRYVDAHNWIFTPSSFRLIMKAMTDMEYVKLSEERFTGTDNHEFYVTFRKSARGCPLSFQELLRLQMIESQHRPSALKTHLRGIYRRFVRPFRKSQ
jgi:predicted SAM-dependent methyltransferase